jgi:hypothetical protein
VFAFGREEDPIWRVKTFLGKISEGIKGAIPKRHSLLAELIVSIYSLFLFGLER